jgi:hypothetical protein
VDTQRRTVEARGRGGTWTRSSTALQPQHPTTGPDCPCSLLSLSPSLRPSCCRPTAPATAAQRPGGGIRLAPYKSVHTHLNQEEWGEGGRARPRAAPRAAPRGGPTPRPQRGRATYATVPAGPATHGRPPSIRPHALHAVHAAQPAQPPPARIAAPRGFADAVEGQLALSSFACSLRRMCWWCGGSGPHHSHVRSPASPKTQTLSSDAIPPGTQHDQEGPRDRPSRYHTARYSP